jgi:drug/metabolite transporter (DMT)-like permease
MDKKKYLSSIMVMATSTVFFSVMAGLVRYASNIDSYKTAFFRFAIGLCLLCTAALFKKIPLTFNKSKLLFLRGFLGGIAVFIYYLSLSKIGIIKGTVIFYAYPIFATIGGVFLLREKVSWKKWVIILSSFIGIYLIASSRTGTITELGVYDIVAIAGSVISGTAIVLVKKLRDTESSYSIYFAQCAIGFWLVVIPANIVPCEIGISGGVILLLIGLTASAGQLCMTYAYRNLPVSTGSLLSMLTPVFSIIIGVILFKEYISLKCLAGIIIVISACVMVLMKYDA